MSLSASLASLRASSVNPGGNVVSDSMETENVMGFLLCKCLCSEEQCRPEITFYCSQSGLLGPRL